MQRVAILAIIGVQTTETYFPWGKKMRVLLKELRERQREEEFIGIYPWGSGTSAWSGKWRSISALQANMYAQPYNN